MVNSNIITIGGVKLSNNRTFKNAPDYLAPTRFKVSIDTPDALFTDTVLVTAVPLSGTEMVDACNSATGWTTTGGTVTVNSVTFKEDGASNGALNLTKTGTASIFLTSAKTATTVSGSSKDLLAWFYVKDSSVVSYLSTTGTAIILQLGTNDANYYRYNVPVTSISTGWNFVKKAIPDELTVVGSPNISSLSRVHVGFLTQTTTQTTDAGDIIVDSIRVASADDYYSTVDSISFDEVEGSVSVLSKLSVSQANGFLVNGHALFTPSSPETMHNKSKYNVVSKSSSQLVKITNKFRKRNV